MPSPMPMRSAVGQGRPVTKPSTIAAIKKATTKPTSTLPERRAQCKALGRQRGLAAGQQKIAGNGNRLMFYLPAANRACQSVLKNSHPGANLARH